MQISEIRIKLVENRTDRLKAFCSVTFDNCFVVRDLKIIEGTDGFFVAMPSRKLPNGDFRDICHPINTDTRTQIQEAVLAQLQAEGGVDAFVAAAEAVE